MTNEEIKKLKEAEPFVPFDIHLAGGRIIHVPHPEFVYVPPITRRFVLAADARGVCAILAIDGIVGARVNGTSVPRGVRRKAG